MSGGPGAKRAGAERAPGSAAEAERAPTTRSGLPLKASYGPEDVRAAPAPPGSYPFTRGIYPTMYRGKPWTIRQYAGFGTPAETNERFRFLLEQGQTGLSLALDLPTQLGLDSDDPEAAGEVGKVGVAIDSLEDMERIFHGIPLDRVSTSMTINATASILLAMYEATATRQGVAPERISGTVQNDLLKEFGARGAWIFPIDPSLRLSVDLIADCVERLPRFNPISIASHYRDAGANPAEELAYTLAAGLAYVEACLARGLEVDRFAPRLSFFFYTYTNFFEEVAKYRAGRRMWAQLLRERFGAKERSSLLMRIACVCGGHSLTRAEPINNVARTTLETLAVACAGVQSVFTAAYDEAFAIPTELSARTALRVQQIVAQETEVAQVADPLGGSYFVEALTDAVEERVREILLDLDAHGGMVECLRSGLLQQRIAKSAYEQQRAIESGAQPVVGVNFPPGRSHADEPADELKPQRLSRTAEEEKARELAKLRAGRDGAEVDRALGRLRETARGADNLMPPIREAVLAYATVGEISKALRDVFGTYEPPTRL
ncbi:MAG: acyl-CoA mutase large subunit family protein [Deltaproteobacteria bacterium]